MNTRENYDRINKSVIVADLKDFELGLIADDYGTVPYYLAMARAEREIAGHFKTH